MDDSSSAAPIEDPPMSSAEQVAYLRARGVEVDLVEERGKRPAPPPLPPPPGAIGAFTFVRVPAESDASVCVEHAMAEPVRDVLTGLLAPRFADDAAMDESTVLRETAGRLKNMFAAGGEGLRAPSAASIQGLAVGGACEAYPLALPSEANGWRSVRLYIDEVGALRGRPRNPRAEALAAAAGLSGLAIHGDAFVGRAERAASGAGERNVDFAVGELAHDAAWVVDARRAHHAAAAARGADADVLPSGDDGGAGLYSWTQTDDEVEVRVRGAPEGKGAAARVKVGYGKGLSLAVAFDGAPVLALEPLFDRVSPDESSWALDGGSLVVTLGKGEPRAWASLCLGMSL